MKIRWSRHAPLRISSTACFSGITFLSHSFISFFIHKTYVPTMCQLPKISNAWTAVLSLRRVQLRKPACDSRVWSPGVPMFLLSLCALLSLFCTIPSLACLDCTLCAGNATKTAQVLPFLGVSEQGWSLYFHLADSFILSLLFHSPYPKVIVQSSFPKPKRESPYYSWLVLWSGLLFIYSCPWFGHHMPPWVLLFHYLQMLH